MYGVRDHEMGDASEQGRDIPGPVLDTQAAIPLDRQIRMAGMDLACRECVGGPEVVQKQRIPIKAGGVASAMHHIKRPSSRMRRCKVGMVIDVAVVEIIYHFRMPDRFSPRAGGCRG